MYDKAAVKKILTFKSGQFAFSPSFCGNDIVKAGIEASVLYQTIIDLPILPDLAAKLNEELLIRSIFGTAAIEGNPLKEEDVKNLISAQGTPTTTKKTEKEILNLRQAYAFADRIEAPESGFKLTEDMIKTLHRMITDGIEHKTNLPGQYRNEIVKVGNAEHGGIYTPPKILDDIRTLMKEFIEWINGEEIIGGSPFASFARAGLAHYHLALIHPFADGNGRTARLVEGMLLKAAGIKYVPRMLSNFYYKNIDDYYWAFSNSLKSDSYDISPFMGFFFKAAVDSLQEIKGRITFFIRKFALRDYYFFLRKGKKISQRQHDLLALLLDQTEGEITLTDLFEKTPYRLLYGRRTQRTAVRDLAKLVEMGILLAQDKTYRLNYRLLG